MTKEEFVERLIGKRYRPSGNGPDEFDCYGLVAYVLKQRQSIDLPTVHRSEDEAAAARSIARAVKRYSRRAGWVAVESPAEWDIVLMANVDGREHHMGIYVVLYNTRWVLHCEPKTGVILDDLATLPHRGFNRITFYRRNGP